LEAFYTVCQLTSAHECREDLQTETKNRSFFRPHIRLGTFNRRFNTYRSATHPIARARRLKFYLFPCCFSNVFFLSLSCLYRLSLCSLCTLSMLSLPMLVTEHTKVVSSARAQHPHSLSLIASFRLEKISLEKTVDMSKRLEWV
jgi:hypothetical protein